VRMMMMMVDCGDRSGLVVSAEEEKDGEGR
jgi:hypothetical protein